MWPVLRGHLQGAPELLLRLGVCPEGFAGASSDAVAGETWLCAKHQPSLTPTSAGCRAGEVVGTQGYRTKRVLQADVDKQSGVDAQKIIRAQQLKPVCSTGDALCWWVVTAPSSCSDMHCTPSLHTLDRKPYTEIIKLNHKSIDVLTPPGSRQ